MSPEKRRLGNWILDRLNERDQLQADLARALGVSNSRVSRWVSGKDQPSRQNCYRIAEALGAHPAYVLALAGHEPMPDTKINLDDPLIQIAVAYSNRLTPHRKQVLGDLIRSIAEEEGTEYESGNGLDSTDRGPEGTG